MNIYENYYGVSNLQNFTVTIITLYCELNNVCDFTATQDIAM